MENGVEALLMAFAVLIFVIALTLSLTTLAQAKSTADTILFYSDRENFQSYVNPDADEQYDGGRTVPIDTVIATLSRCIKENYAVIIIDGAAKEEFDYAMEYKTELKNHINTFITNNINSTNQYRETYIEVTLNGKVYESEGIRLEEDVGKKIYIIYKKI